MFIFVHFITLGNVMRLLMSPRPSLQLYLSFTIICWHHSELIRVNKCMSHFCPHFVPFSKNVPKIWIHQLYLSIYISSRKNIRIRHLLFTDKYLIITRSHCASQSTNSSCMLHVRAINGRKELLVQVTM